MRPINCNLIHLIRVNYHNQLCSSWSGTEHNISALGFSSFFQCINFIFCSRLVDGERHTVEIKRCKINAAKNINLFFFFRGTQKGEWSRRDISSALRPWKVSECGAQALNPGLHVGVSPDVNCHSGPHNNDNQSSRCCSCFCCGGSMAPFLLATWTQSACFST